MESSSFQNLYGKLAQQAETDHRNCVAQLHIRCADAVQGDTAKSRKGGFIEGYYIVGLLASVLLRGHPGGKVVHDPRLTWNTVEVVKAHGGVPVLSKSGHAFIKQRMREVDGVYGGEMSAHHYFQRFAYCDSGMIPWLIVAQILCESGLTLSQLVGERIGLFPVSGELNYRVPDAKAAIVDHKQLAVCQSKCELIDAENCLKEKPCCA